jgi:hypothetical protein
MRIVTAEAFTLFNRLMYYPFELFSSRIGMAGVAKIFDLQLKQTAEPGDMGVVAGEAISIGYRFMIHPFLKRIALMAIETFNNCHHRSLALFMALGAGSRRKRFVAYGIEQVFLRSTMGIMTGDTRFRSRSDSLMSADKACVVKFMTFGTKLTTWCQGQVCMV